MEQLTKKSHPSVISSTYWIMWLQIIDESRFLLTKLHCLGKDYKDSSDISEKRSREDDLITAWFEPGQMSPNMMSQKHIIHLFFFWF